MLVLFSYFCLAFTLAAASTPDCTGGHADCFVEEAAEASLLQARMVAERKVAEEPKQFIQMDGSTKIPVPRREVQGFAREVLLSYPLKSNPITVSKGKVRIELAKIMEGRFSRDAFAAPDGADHLQEELISPTEQQDYGIEKAVAFIGKRSMISKKVKLAFAEKSHTMYMSEEVSHATEKQMEKMKSGQNGWDQKRSKWQRDMRNSALAVLSVAIGPQIIGAGQDANVIASVRNLSVAADHKPDAPFTEAYQRSSAELNRRKGLVTRTEPIRSSIGCLHFEDSDLMKFSDDAVEVPLNKKIVAYRGRLASTPNKEYQMSTGIAIFFHNEASDSLDVFFGFSSVVDIADSAKGYASLFTVGPADGASMPIEPEGRNDSFAFPAIGKLSWNTANSVPRDFDFMHQQRSQVGCPDDVLKGLPDQVDNIQDFLESASDVSMGSILGILPNVGHYMDTLLNEISCGVEFLRPVNRSSVVAFGRLGAVGLLHVLMEMPGDIMVTAFATDGLWNNITLQ